MRTINLPSTRFDVSRTAFNNALNEAVKEKFGTLDKRHSDYLTRELELIKDVPDEWLSHLLIASDLVKAMKAKKPFCISEGRGTIVASFAAYLLDITGLDPVLFNLSPERFYVLAKTRPTPDTDIDIASSCKDDAIKYLLDVYGEKNVVRPITFSKDGNMGVHACAYFISTVPFNEIGDEVIFPNYTSTCTIIDKTMSELEELGLLRINIISTKIQDELMKAANSCKSFNIDEVTDYTKVITKKNLDGVNYGSFLKKMNIECKTFDDVLFCISSIKFPHLSLELSKGRIPKNLSFKNEEIDKIVEKTNGFILHQEQVIDILRYVLDVDYYNAYVMRKEIGKKNMKAVRHIFADFTKSLTDKGMNPNAVIRLWNELCTGCENAIVKSHCVSIAYNAIEHAYFNEKGE